MPPPVPLSRRCFFHGPAAGVWNTSSTITKPLWLPRYSVVALGPPPPLAPMAPNTGSTLAPRKRTKAAAQPKMRFISPSSSLQEHHVRIGRRDPGRGEHKLARDTLLLLWQVLEPPSLSPHRPTQLLTG